MNNLSTQQQQQLVQSLTIAVLGQLRGAAGTNANTPFANLAQEILRQPLSATPSPVTPITRPRTPADVRFSDVNTPQGTAISADQDTPLSRSSSISSTASINSTASIGSDADFQIHRRTPSSAQKRADNRAVTRTILSDLDAEILALHPDVANPMFRHKFKRGFNALGRRTLKRYKDIVLSVFRERTRRPLRQLTARDLPNLQRENPNLTYNELRARYYAAALRVVKKRRANHVQSWRLDKNGTHLPLIYGGVYHAPPAGALPGATTPPTPPAPSASATTPSSALSASTTTPSTASAVTTTVAATITPSPSTVTTTPSAVITEPVSSADAEPDFPAEQQMICDCGVELSAATAFPKERWGEDSKVWCEECHKKVKSDMVNKHVHDDRKRKATLQEVTAEVTAATAGRRKRKKLTQCKHCGSKTHFTIRSKHCPHNPRNKNGNEVSTPAAPAETQVDSSESVDSDDETESVDWDAPIPEEETFNVLDDEPTPSPSASPAPETPAPPASPTPAPPPAATPEFTPVRGDNVLVTEDGKVYLAQLFKVDDDGYHVYFVNAPDDDDTRVVSLDRLSPETTPSPKRADFLNAEFYFDGAPDLARGRWKVRRIEGDKNQYVCVRLSGGTTRCKSLENFDISYVMGEVRAEEEYVRERGPFCTGRR